MKKISVIIPCYNVEQYVEGAIGSLLVQTHTNLEVICLDDCSTDNTYVILQNLQKKDSRICVYKNEENIGVIKTLNKLISIATSDIIVRMDSDDYFEPTRIEELYTASQKYECNLVSSDYSVIDKEDKIISNHKGLYLPTLHNSIRFMAMYNSPFPSQALFKREVLALNLYDDKYKVAEDYYHFTQLLLNERVRGHNVAKKLYRYRINPNGLTSTNQQMMNDNHISIAKEYISVLLQIDTEGYDFWKLSKRCIDYNKVDAAELEKLLVQIRTVKKLFLEKYKVSKEEKKEIKKYQGQYLLYTYFCMMRDARKQNALSKVLLIMMKDLLCNFKDIVLLNNLKWLLKNI